MKVFIVLSALVVLAAAAPRQVYEHQAEHQQQHQYQAAPKQEYRDYETHSHHSKNEQKHIPIVKFEAEQSKSGYKFGYEAANGIQVIEQGQVKNEGQKDEANVAEGFYSYKGDDGKQYSVQYVADEHGFRAVGDHLPTPPALPEENQKLIAEVYARPTSKYDEEDYGHYEEEKPQQQQHQQVKYQPAQHKPVYHHQHAAHQQYEH